MSRQSVGRERREGGRKGKGSVGGGGIVRRTERTGREEGGGKGRECGGREKEGSVGGGGK